MVSGVSVQVSGKTGFRYGSPAIVILKPETCYLAVNNIECGCPGPRETQF